MKSGCARRVSARSNRRSGYLPARSRNMHSSPMKAGPYSMWFSSTRAPCGGEPLYPTVQARAAHLLYFVIKDHPFSDGNKRIGTLLFLDYLRRNRFLTRAAGTPRLADNAMVALALLIAESDPAHKDLMIRLILNLL